MPLLATRDLALYASVVGTLSGGWTLYHGVVRDRPRIAVSVAEGVDMYGGESKVLMIRVSNRGRRDFRIDQVTREMSVRRGTRLWVRELAVAVREGPDRLGDGDGYTYMLGPIGYTPGKLPTTRWFVTDGTGRIYPLRERHRQRVERIVLWPIRRVLAWRDARAGTRAPSDDGEDHA